MAPVLGVIVHQIQSGTYRPGPVREIQIPKASGGYRVISVANLPDRIVARAAYLAVAPHWDPQFGQNVYGFRPGRSPLHLLADLGRGIETTGNTILVQDDIRKAFDEVRVNLVREDIQASLGNARYVDLIQKISGVDDPEGRERGIQQGSAISPLLLLMHLHRRHDSLLSEAGQLPFESWYADNRITLASNARDGEARMAKTRELLERAGLSLKGDTGRAIELKEESAEVLGFTICVRNGRLRFSLPETAWTSLEESLRKCHEAENPVRAATSMITGWTWATRPALTTHGEMITRRIRRTLRDLGLGEAYGPEGIKRTVDRARNAWTEMMEGEQCRPCIEPGRDHLLSGAIGTLTEENLAPPGLLGI